MIKITVSILVPFCFVQLLSLGPQGSSPTSHSIQLICYLQKRTSAHLYKYIENRFRLWKISQECKNIVNHILIISLSYTFWRSIFACIPFTVSTCYCWAAFHNKSIIAVEVNLTGMFNCRWLDN